MGGLYVPNPIKTQALKDIDKYFNVNTEEYENLHKENVSATCLWSGIGPFSNGGPTASKG